MLKCKKYQAMFEAALGRDLPDEELTQLEEHLRGCDACAREYGELEAALSFMMKRERSEPSDNFMENFWDNLEPELQKKESLSNTIMQIWLNILDSFLLRRKYAYQFAGAAAILMIGIFIGKYDVTPEAVDLPVENQMTQSNVQQVAMQARADKYINKSKILLLGLMNFDPAEDIEAINLPRQKKISTELIAEAAELKNEFNKPSQRQLKELITDLEVILLQIANLETEFDLSGIDLVKDGVDRRGIFLKINIREMLGNKIEAGQTDGKKKSLERKEI